MNKAFLLGGLFLRVSSVYAAATHGDLIAEGRRRNEEVYERSLEDARGKAEDEDRVQKQRTTQSRKEREPETKKQKEVSAAF